MFHSLTRFVKRVPSLTNMNWRRCRRKNVGGERSSLLSSFSQTFCTNARRANTKVFKSLRDKTKFSVVELDSLFNSFKRSTKDDDSLNKEEFFSFLKKLGVSDDNLISSAFQVYDEDGNGRIDFKEFASSMSVLTRGTPLERYELAFKIWDTDSNGELDKDEFRSFLNSTQNSQVSDVVFNEIFSSLDVNGSGTLSLSECKKGIAKFQIFAPSLFSEVMVKDEDVPYHQREILALLGEKKSFSANQVLQKEDELHDTQTSRFYVLLNGTVELSRNGVVIEEVNKSGGLISEEILFSPQGFLFTAKSKDEVEVLEILSSDLSQLALHGHAGTVSLIERIGNVVMQRMNNVSSLAVKEDKLSTDKDFTNTCNKVLTSWALRYHSLGAHGKVGILSTKQVGTAAELSVAYSPGVAEPCLAIKEEPQKAYDYTSKSHLVGVISNGTAVLGLGNIGALASKPVMEGKAVLFKKFGGVDAFDIEVNETDPDKFINIVCSLEPTFGGVNIEDVKAPECFYIEKEVQRRCSIPIMHDDQHGTAIISGAGLLNALELVKKKIEDIKVVVCGVGAAGFTCARYFLSLGVKRENLLGVDIKGVIYNGRDDLDPSNYLSQIAVTTNKRSLSEAVEGADVFLGVSAGGLLKPEMLKKMNANPLVFACANPTPEIHYNIAKRTREDVIMATGRSDYPNQINNVCAFPYIFRGALDVQATAINEEMKQAATKAIATIARNDPQFGVEYLIPKPSDPRLKVEVSSSVARAAIESGVAGIKLDVEEYRDKLEREKLN